MVNMSGGLGVAFVGMYLNLWHTLEGSVMFWWLEVMQKEVQKCVAIICHNRVHIFMFMLLFCSMCMIALVSSNLLSIELYIRNDIMMM